VFAKGGEGFGKGGVALTPDPMLKRLEGLLHPMFFFSKWGAPGLCINRCTQLYLFIS
jgi:hypothetical protein